MSVTILNFVCNTATRFATKLWGGFRACSFTLLRSAPARLCTLCPISPVRITSVNCNTHYNTHHELMIPSNSRIYIDEASFEEQTLNRKTWYTWALLSVAASFLLGVSATGLSTVLWGGVWTCAWSTVRPSTASHWACVPFTPITVPAIN